MTIPQKYFHDKLVLFLISTNTFLTLLTNLVILLRFDTHQGNSYVVQCRSNLGLDAFQKGGILQIVQFMLFTVIVLVMNTFLSMKIYPRRRSVALIVLVLGTLLLILSLIVVDLILARVSCVNYE